MLKLNFFLVFALAIVFFTVGCQTQRPTTNTSRRSAMGIIGMSAIATNGVVVVTQVLEGYSADLAGIRPEDQILQIGNNITTGMTTQTACELLRGPQRTSIKLLIKSSADNTTRSVSLARCLSSPGAKWKKFTDPHETGVVLPLPVEPVAPF